MISINNRILSGFGVAVMAMSGAGSAAAQTQGLHPSMQPRMFDSPEAAVKALTDAVSNDDTLEMKAVLGSDAKGILTSGDAGQDRDERREFSKLASEKHRVEHSSMNSKTAVLLVGNEDWPFPVPLVLTGQQWHFDPELGALEGLARRIGTNELDAIEICAGYGGAQEEYAAQNPVGKAARVYAQTIMSSANGKNGLYQQGAPRALVPEGFAMADASLPSAGRKPYHGYFFRVLKAQGPNARGGAHNYVAGGAMIGGFALIAWPADYGVTGIHTFVISHDGEVFEKDFGPRTPALTQPIVRYDPDSSWTVVN